MTQLFRRDISFRHVLLLGATFVVSVLSCGREITGPSGAGRMAHGLSFLAQFPGPLASVETGAGSVVAFDRVRVLFLRSDGSAALDRILTFPSDSSQLALQLSVPISRDAPAAGEPLALLLRYLNPAGDTVFAGGPVSVTAVPNRSDAPPPQPVDVPLAYVGPGAEAAAVVMSPDTLTVVAGDTFTFTAEARDAQAAALPDAPLVWTSLDPARAVLDDIGAGTGRTLPSRGSARLRVSLITGAAADTATLIVLPRPDSLSVREGAGQSTPVGTQLPLPVRVRLVATDNLGIADCAIAVIASNGGTVSDTLPITDVNGEVSVLWTLGPTAGPQTLTLTGAGVAARTVTATALAAVNTAVRLAIVSDNAPNQSAGTPVTSPVVAHALDAQGVLDTTFVGSVSVEAVQQPVDGVLLGTLSATAVRGIATLGAWTTNRVGDYRVRVVASGLSPDTSIVFRFGAGAPYTLVLQSGGAQTAFVNDTVPAPIVVQVLDSLGNRVSGTAVTFIVRSGGGTLGTPTAITDTLGVARLTGWVLGPTPGLNELEATAGTAGPLVVAATGELPPPAVQLSVFGSNVVGVDRAGTLTVRLLQAAPAGGVTVSVISDQPQFLTIAAPGTVSFVEGQTLGSIAVSGIALGTATVRGTAPGYTPDTLAVPVSLNLITAPSTLNVPLALTASWPLSLSSPAPAGGVTLALVSDNPGIAQPVADSVFIPAGAQSANVAVEGLALGTVTLRATNPNYALDETVATVSAGLDITANTYAINESFGLPATIRLVSGGSPVAAPPGGVTIALSTGDSTCAAVPPTATIAQGLTSVTVDVVYGGSAVTPCSTPLRAVGPQSFTSDSATVNVAVQPNTGLPAQEFVGSGLQRAESGTLTASNHGGTTVRITSADSSRLLIAPNASTVGTGSLDLPIGIGLTSYSFVVQAVDGLVGDTVYVRSAAPGFLTDSVAVIIYQPVYELVGVNTSATTLTVDDAFTVRIGTANSPGSPSMWTIDARRAGADSLRPVVRLDSTGIVQLVRTAGVSDSTELVIAPGVSQTPTTVAAGGVAVRYVGQGTDSVRVLLPGFRALSGATRGVTVTQPSISSLSAFSIGAGLQNSGIVSLSQAAIDSVFITMTYDRPGVALLSPSDAVVGSDTLVLVIPPGAINTSFWVQALEGATADTLTLSASAPGFTARTAQVRVYQPIIEIVGLNATGTTLTADDAFYARIGSPNSPTGTFLNTVDAIRAGAQPLAVTFFSDSAGIGTLVRSDTVAESLTLTIPAGASNTPTTVASGGVAFRYLAEGVTTVRVEAPPMRLLATAAGRAVTVSQPSINALIATSIGKGLQRSASVTLSQTPTDTVRVQLRLDTTGVVLLAPNDSTVGADSLELVFPPGVVGLTYWVQALEDVPDDTLTLSATATGWTGRTAAIRVWDPIIQVSNLAASMPSLNANDEFIVRLGTPTSPTSATLNTVDPVRAGADTVTVRVASSVGTVGQLVTSTVTSDSVDLRIAPRASTTPVTVAGGGIAFDPLTTGTTDVTATAPGFRNTTSATVTVTVIPPAITLSTGNATVGAGLQVANSGSFNTAGHNGRALVIRSSNPAVLRVAPNTTTPATDSIVITMAAGQTSFTYYIVGVEGTTGTVTVTASADGFLDANVSRTVVQPAITLSTNLAATGTAGVTADDPFTASIGIPNAGLTALSQAQLPRAGLTVAVTVASSDSTVGTLVTLADSSGAASVTVNVLTGTTATATSVATGGVAFRFLGAGTTTVSATAPGFIQLSGGQRIVTVASP